MENFSSRLVAHLVEWSILQSFYCGLRCSSQTCKTHIKFSIIESLLISCEFSIHDVVFYVFLLQLKNHYPVDSAIHISYNPGQRVETTKRDRFSPKSARYFRDDS